MEPILIGVAKLLLLLLALLLLLTFIPIDLKFNLEVGNGHRTGAKVVWLFGMVEKSLMVEWRTRKERSDKTETKDKVRPKKERKDRGSRWGEASRVLRDREFMGRLLGFVLEAFGSVKVKEFKAKGRFGFEDPADTGVAFGHLWAVSSLIDPLDLRLTPCFEEEVLEGWAKGTVRFQPYKMVMPTLRFLASVNTLKTIHRLGRRW